MLHAKFQNHRTSGSGEEDFKGFYNIWAWWLPCLCDLNHLYKIWLPHPKDAPHKIWLSLAKRFQRRSLKMVDDVRTPARWVYYKLTL